MDDELNPRARMLVDVALEEDVPPPSVADGSWEVVISRLTAEAARTETTPAATTPRGRGPFVLVVIGLIVVVAGALLWLVLQPRPKRTSIAPVAPPSERDTPTTKDPTTVPAKSDTPIDPAPLLDEAEHAEPARALELLDRHAELAPLGADTERRMTLRIESLCALGRTDDAKADARAFLGRPRDPKWTKRVRESCAAP